MLDDIQMTRSGDLAIVHYDIHNTDSVEQRIMIHLRWFLGEWVYNEQYGVDYWGSILIKNPNSLLVRRLIADEILKCDEVTSVSDVTLAVNRKTREGRITAQIETSQGHLDFMETLDFWNYEIGMKVYASGNTLVIEKAGPYCYAEDKTKTLVFPSMSQAEADGDTLVLQSEVV